MVLSYSLHAQEDEAQQNNPQDSATVADAEDAPEQAKESTAPAPATLPKPVATNTSGTAAVLPQIEVSGARIRDQRIDKTQSTTTVTSRDLERIQAATIFDAVRDVPGVEVSGGPRVAGMAFNIRGFQDNADVMIKVDGVRKSFEKYRMGGTFVDPELLKSIEVQRGPQIASGSGSIGGTVLMQTKDAADLLEPGRKTGARIKFGYGNNNDEYLRSYTAYARPHERVDLIYNYTSRNSNNFTLPKGSVLSVGATPTTSETELNYSSTSSEAQLLKVSVFPVDSLQLSTSLVKYKDSALALYDQITNQANLFRQVYRDVDDTSITENIRFNPDDIAWIDFKAVLGVSRTDVLETTPQEWGTNRNPRPAGGRTCRGFTLYDTNGTVNNTLQNQCRGDRFDDYQFKNTAIEFSNNASLYQSGDLEIGLLAGFQHNKNERVASTYYVNPAARASDSIPSGTQSFNAIYLQPRFEWGRFSVIPGLRYDRYATEAGGFEQQLLQAENLQDEMRFRQRSTSLGLNFDIQPKRLSLFANYSQGFRAPTLAHYFSQDLLTCDFESMPINRPIGTPQFCGNLYKPQLSESTEAGVSYRTPNFFGSGAEVVSKLTFYHVFTKNLLRSLRETSTGEVTQDGWERRNGLELETAVEYKKSYLRLAYSRNRGKMYDVLNRQMVERSITTIPGNTINVTLGTGAIANFDAYVSYRRVGERLIAGGRTQDQYEIFNAGIHYTVNKHLGFRLIGENLNNKAYNYNGGGDFADQIGLPAPGRNIRFLAEITY